MTTSPAPVATPASPAVCRRHRCGRFFAVQAGCPDQGWGVWEREDEYFETRMKCYPDAPGMDACVALRRYLAEREQIKREKGGE